MTLRVPRAGGDPVLTLPRRVSLSEGRAFAEAQAEWLRRATSRQIVAQPVDAGVLLPVEGRPMRVTPFPIRGARIEGNSLLIPGNRPAAPVIQAFLRHLALQRLHSACDGFAADLGREYRAITLRDTRSRWGSCTSDGRLMFSWRLAMAPPGVLTYVAAHEVAHLAHMDHSPRFWAQVEALMPGHKPYRDWLRRHGNELLAWQFRD
ncbi:M48 family peptidase [Paracoccus alkanivorans]|uniref:M48 family peptidase n=2 Tax=Paracoccus alkanivorans TaxID=2116655 RepID=A0A3M0M6B6_9RHOB|nr:M48 family peptidase [Paracoccus alkanivorans]